MTQSRIAGWLGRSDIEWLLLSLWAALLGVEFYALDLANFRWNAADFALGALMLVLVARRPGDLYRAVIRRAPVNIALACLFVALLWGSIVSLLRTGTLVIEAAMNKDLGFFVLVSVVAAITIVVRDRDEVRLLLRNFLVAGTVVSWMALITQVLIPLVTADPHLNFRFLGFLLNPSANALFLSVLLMIQLGLARASGAVGWQRWLQAVNALGLTFLLLQTLSRSSWIATLIALVLAIAFVTRDRPLLPAVVAVILVAFTGQSLARALLPVAVQVSGGNVGTFQREIAPASTPPPNLDRLLASATQTASPTIGSASTRAPTATLPPLSSVDPSATGVERYLQVSRQTASDEFGATDRLAFSVAAGRLWLSSKSTMLGGLGLDVFLLVSPKLFGTPVIIHNTYVWLPVEMGIPGIVALLALLYAMFWTARSVMGSGADRSIALAIIGPMLVFVVWVAENEGLYQRTLWMTLALGAVAVLRPGTPNRQGVT